MKNKRLVPVKKISSSKVSLLERRKKTMISLPLSRESRNPIDSLKEGVYDIRSNDLSSTGEFEELQFDQKITAFLEEENVRPVLLNQYMKDLQQYKLTSLTSVKEAQMSGGDHAMTENETPKSE